MDPAIEGLDCANYKRDYPALLADICKDNQRAMSCLFKQLQAYMLGTMRQQAFWRKRQTHLIKDAFLDSFVVLIRKIQSGQFVLNQKASIQSYFYSIYQRVLKNLQYKGRESEKKLEAYLALLEEEIPQEEFVIQELDRLALFQHALSQLKEECRHLVTMRTYQELSYKEISKRDQQGRSENALKTHYYRCLQALKEKLSS